MGSKDSANFQHHRVHEVMLKVFEAVAEGGVIRLPMDAPASAHCVVAILDGGLDTLREQSRMELPQSTQGRLSELLSKNREGTLTAEERRELDLLGEEFDAATLARGRALAALANLSEGSQSNR
jgi:hypothetical protein